jgi:hypothetical protein
MLPHVGEICGPPSPSRLRKRRRGRNGIRICGLGAAARDCVVADEAENRIAAEPRTLPLD